VRRAEAQDHRADQATAVPDDGRPPPARSRRACRGCCACGR
jgi:hypothetical protein